MYDHADPDMLRILAAKTGKVLFAYDLGTRSLSFLNEAYSALWGRTRESALGDPATVWESVHPDDRGYLAKEYRELAGGILRQEIEFRIVLPDNSVRWLSVSPHLTVDGQGKGTGTGIVDHITALEESIANMQKFAAKKDSVLEILSHDLAGPLNNIHSLTEVLSESTQGYGNEEVDEVIRIIRESSARNVRLIREFVQQEFLESSQTVMKKSRVDLGRMVSDIIEQYREGEGHILKQIEFTSPSEKFYAQVDEYKFSQVVNNLLSNAIKFTEDDGVIAIVLSERDGTILVTVKDDGVGIPEKYHAELFEKFTRARRPGLRGEPSTGLGMSIIKTIVEWHGGRIRFESEEGKGTTFHIELPGE